MELAGDFYDYHLQYYRWFLHRRLVFSEFDSNELKRLTSYQIMKNDDRANIGSLLSQTTLLGASAGLGCGAMRYAVDTTARQVPKLKATRTGLSMIVLGSNLSLVVSVCSCWRISSFCLFLKRALASRTEPW